MKQKFLVFIIAVLLLSLTACQEKYPETVTTVSEVVTRAKDNFTMAEITKDANTLVQNVESKHVMFGLKKVPKEYNAAKQEFLTSLKDNMSFTEFAYAANKYLAILKDAHTVAYPKLQDSYLHVTWRWDGENLKVVDGNLPVGAVINSVAGLEVADFAELARQYAPAENTSADQLNVENMMKSLNFNTYLQNDINDNKVEIVYTLDGETITKAISFSDAVGQFNVEPIRYEKIGDTFIFYLTQCKFTTEWDKAYYAMTALIAKEDKNPEEAFSKVVIDVRGNPGGDSRAATKILTALGMELSEYGSTSYYNEEAAAKFKKKVGQIDKVAPNNNGRGSKYKLYVLTDRESFSAAMMLGVYAQDGGLGKVIGEIPSNSPTFYGDSFSYYLPNTKLMYTVSWREFQRPDKKQSQTELVPDVIVNYGEDAMDYINK